MAGRTSRPTGRFVSPLVIERPVYISDLNRHFLATLGDPGDRRRLLCLSLPRLLVQIAEPSLPTRPLVALYLLLVGPLIHMPARYAAIARRVGLRRVRAVVVAAGHADDESDQAEPEKHVADGLLGEQQKRACYNKNQRHSRPFCQERAKRLASAAGRSNIIIGCIIHMPMIIAVAIEHGWIFTAVISAYRPVRCTHC